jgi:hypothetical protein
VKSWIEYEVKLPPSYGRPGWRRTKFSHRPWDFGVTEEPTDEKHAAEMLIVAGARMRPGAKLRLVRVTEEVIGDEYETPEYAR